MILQPEIMAFIMLLCKCQSVFYLSDKKLRVANISFKNQIMTFGRQLLLESINKPRHQ